MTDGAGVPEPISQVRAFASGATRHTDEGKPDYEAALSPLVLRGFAEYMLAHSIDPDGNARAMDNWQAGFPLDVLMKSTLRHVHDAWMLHRGWTVEHGYEPDRDAPTLEESLYAIMFNVQAYLHELLKEGARADR